MVTSSEKQNTLASPSFVIDIGAHNGDDTAYYLHCGFSVIAVEANPILARELRNTFSGAPVTVENVCIAPENASSTDFWVNEANSTWSSFDRKLAERDGTSATRFEVPAITAGALLERYGVPHYLKIDIEGMDFECLKTLTPPRLPRYISLELGTGYGEGILEGLQVLGYRRFKIINQVTFTSAVPIFDHEIGWRLLRKLRVGRLIPNGIKSDFDNFVDGDWKFNEGCSGPFGEHTFGDWMSGPKAEALCGRIQRKFVRDGVRLADCWYDMHAAL